MPHGIGWFPLVALVVTIALVVLTRRQNNNDKRG
jgi:hypothetical protein